MHKLVVLYPQPTDPEAFVDYYTNKHLPLAATLPGLQGYSYSFNVESGTPDPAPYFAYFEGNFADAQTFAAAMGSDIGKAVNADVPNYATGGAHVLHFDVEQG